MTFNTILFDLDGTLTDPYPGISQSITYALEKMNAPALDAQTLTTFIGPPLLQSFQEVCGFTEQQAHEALEYYRERFSTKGLYENSVYDGISDLLSSLKNSGKTLAVATSKPTVFAERILNHFQLTQYFDVIVGSNLDGTRNEKNEVIHEVLTQLNIIANESIIMIGDRKHDILGAQKEGIQSIGVLYGYGSFEEIQQAGATYIVEKVEDILPLL
ncbi:MAG: HAD family hydrolase [Lysinibacillus sp.]